MAAGCAAPQTVENASFCSCAAATLASSSP